MSNNLFEYMFKITSNAEAITASMGKLNATVEKVEASTVQMDHSFTKAFDSIQKDVKAIKLSSILDQVDRVTNSFTNLNKPGMELSTSMYDLSAMTGVAGEKLDQIEKNARKSGLAFGNSAASGAEAYKLILGQLTPKIAEVPDALDAMGKSVGTTSKLMGGDQVAATQLLTTAMNQYQVSLEDPIKASGEMAKMMNVMAAAAGEGSAELPQIKLALEQAGMGAKMANVSFEETNAALQILDKAGKKGSEGGVALRNVLVKLGQGKYIPKEYQKQLQLLGVDTTKLADKNATLSERLAALKPAMKDSALLSAWLGEGADGATKALIEQIPELERLTGAITGTNEAYEQAAIVMESPLEKNKRLQAQIDDFKISLFNGTNGLIGYADVLGGLARDVSDMSPLFSGMATVFSTLASAQKRAAFFAKVSSVWNSIAAVATNLLATAQWNLNIAMDANPVGLIILAIMALLTYVTIAIKRWDEFGAAMLLMLGPIGWIINGFMTIKKHWDSIAKAFTTDGIIGGLKRIGLVFFDMLLYPMQQLLELLAKIPGLENLAGGGAEKIKALRKSMDLVTPDEAQKEVEAKAGILPPTVPGTTLNENGKPVDGTATNKTNEAIATGGTKNTVINITLKNLIESVQITGKDFKDSANQMKEQSQDALMRVLASANTAAG
ncbi:phage tail tape measure protein [Flavobacterium sp. GA093]|uniref:Phage tail tape measure protein n=1 Tax=Flavobacterium hydrocarbonoxydans TaxID=2683249 RepID=A0A6I4NMW2_9FLAO|nr:phage tail tape measure protein [Flavobacterium hydrocarbonoxydans]MWB92989.1 phage tail tape measure protein [Flavobacterium hydrocarbonoxydans]